VKHLFSRDCVDVVAQLAWSRVLLAFDFDGTLSPIVSARDAARMRPRTAKLFANACDLYPCAVISGRSRGDVIARLDGGAPARVVGNHGIEPGVRTRAFEAQMSHVRDALAHVLADEQGIDIEDKRYSLAIHYRRARSKRRARARITAALVPHARTTRTIPGKLVVNVLPARAPNKGDALRDLRKQLGVDTALYVGDDVTDEDVFSLDEPGRLVTVRVGRSTRSAASYYVRDQREIDTLLDLFVRLRKDDVLHGDFDSITRRHDKRASSER